VGSIADTGCFSFYPTKNLGAIGDGGAITTSRVDVLERAQWLRTYGWTKPQLATIADGRCSRLDELQAAVLNVKLNRLAEDVDKRRSIAERYNAGFADLPIVLPHPPAGRSHAYHLYVIRSDRRDALARHLDAAGIGTGIHYPYPVHRQPGLVGAARIPQPLSVTETLAGEILSLIDQIQAVGVRARHCASLKFIQDHGSSVLTEKFYTDQMRITAETLLPLIK